MIYRAAICLTLGAVSIPAFAREREAIISASMDVSTAPCTVQGAAINLGSFFNGQPKSAVAAVNGSVDASGAVVATGVAPRTLATIRCGLGTSYTITVDGASQMEPGSGYTDLAPAGGDPVLTVVPVLLRFDGGDTGPQIFASGRGSAISGFGTGVDQEVAGTFAVYVGEGTGSEAIAGQGQLTSVGSTLITVEFIPTIPSPGT